MGVGRILYLEIYTNFIITGELDVMITGSGRAFQVENGHVKISHNRHSRHMWYAEALGQIQHDELRMSKWKMGIVKMTMAKS